MHNFSRLNTTAANGNYSKCNLFIPGTVNSYKCLISVGNYTSATNGASGADTYIAYCFKSIAGYSQSLEVIYRQMVQLEVVETGFKPGWIMLSKSTSRTSDNWRII